MHPRFDLGRRKARPSVHLTPQKAKGAPLPRIGAARIGVHVTLAKQIDDVQERERRKRRARLERVKKSLAERAPSLGTANEAELAHDAMDRASHDREVWAQRADHIDLSPELRFSRARMRWWPRSRAFGSSCWPKSTKGRAPVLDRGVRRSRGLIVLVGRRWNAPKDEGNEQAFGRKNLRNARAEIAKKRAEVMTLAAKLWVNVCMVGTRSLERLARRVQAPTPRGVIPLRRPVGRRARRAARRVARRVQRDPDGEPSEPPGSALTISDRRAS